MNLKSLILAAVVICLIASQAAAQRVVVRVRGNAGGRANVNVAAVNGFRNNHRGANVNAVFVNGFAASPQFVGSPVILSNDPRFLFTPNGVFIGQSTGGYYGGCGRGGAVLLGVGGGCW